MTTTRESTNPVGYLSNNWDGFENDSDGPALIVNPNATPMDLLGWCWGEVCSLRSAASVLATAGELIEPGDMAAIFLQRLEPLTEVMRLAVSELHSAQRVVSDAG